MRIASALDLIATKLRAARLQDDYDVSEILRRQTIDEQALAQLVTAAEFAHYQEVQARAQRERRAE